MAHLASKHIAVIDLGSNTFHLLICAVRNSQFEEIFRQRIFVALAEDGIEMITESAIKRAESALKEFKLHLTSHPVESVSIIGTAALRSALNASQIMKLSKEILNQDIQIIDGDKEAELIYKGVSSIVNYSDGYDLIMDIGGGSTEFILVKSGDKLWSSSYDIGVGVLYNMFHTHDPICQEDIDALKAHLDSILTPLYNECKDKMIRSLIGASGSFEVVTSMSGETIENHKVAQYKSADFYALAPKVILSHSKERASFKGMPASRVKLIVVAFILIEHVLTSLSIDTIKVSPYALKEGVISEQI